MQARKPPAETICTIRHGDGALLQVQFLAADNLYLATAERISVVATKPGEKTTVSIISASDAMKLIEGLADAVGRVIDAGLPIK